MTPRDNLDSPSTSIRSRAGDDVLNERATPQPTVLSRVWEGPPDGGEAEDAEDHSVALDLDVHVARSRIFRWLIAPATRRRAIVITTIAAMACGAVLAVGEMDVRGSDSTAAHADIDATRGSLSSSAVDDDESVASADSTDGSVEDGVADDGRSTDPASVAREAVSADERLRLQADPLGTATGSWMLEAQPSTIADSTPVVRFTVNGVVVEEVERAPYRLLLDLELVASFPDAAVEGQPLIVTASALWPDGGETAGPATVVLPNPSLR